MKRIIISVTNDLTGDNRVHKVATTLRGMGFSVLLAGRRLKSSDPALHRQYPCIRMHLLFRKGAGFYAEYNFRLLCYLLFHRFDLLLSNDLDTLPANFIAAKIKGKPLVYDSHEYFSEVPELIGREAVRSVWLWIERKIIPGVDAAYTVSRSIAGEYTRKYKKPFEVVQNLPFRLVEVTTLKKEVAGNGKTIIYQGALNKGRGLKQAIEAMQFLDDAVLILAGSGDLERELKDFAEGMELKNVHFTGRLPIEKLTFLTVQAHLGISVEEDLGLSYRYSLPNKLFDYIQARIPVVVSDLPEMSRVVREYDIGLVAGSIEPELLAATFKRALNDQALREKWSVNLETAASVFTWENEEKKVRKIFEKFL